jgi:hypothetical protein
MKRWAITTVLFISLLIVLAGSFCWAQWPRIDVTADVQDGKVIFDIPHRGINCIYALVRVSQISARSASVPADDFRAGGGRKRTRLVANFRVAFDLACTAEKLGKLRHPGFQL